MAGFRSVREPWLFQEFVQWTPDGSTVLFTDGPLIYAIAADGSRLWQVVERPVTVSGRQIGFMAPFTLSPDGAELIYATCAYPDPHRAAWREAAGEPLEENDYRHELVRVRVDGTQRQRLTENRVIESRPAWSPDGTRIAYLSHDHRYAANSDPLSTHLLRLYTMAPDGSSVAMVRDGFVNLHQSLEWSPDGKRLAYVRHDSESAVWLYTVVVDGGAPRRLTSTASPASWSPDGKRLAFAKADGDEVALFTIAADGTDAQRVTTLTGWQLPHAEPDPTRAWIGLMAWSPSGRHVLYSCALTVCVVDLESKRVVQAPLAPRYPEGVSLAAWAPDGARIALVSPVGQLKNRISESDPIVLYTMAPDGTDLRLLVARGKHYGGSHHDRYLREGPQYMDVTGCLRGTEPQGHRDCDRFRRIGPRHVEDPADAARCAAGIAVPEPAANPGLIQDCETLLGLRDALVGIAEFIWNVRLNWNVQRPIAKWEGVGIDGSPPRVTALTLDRRSLLGIIPAELGELTQLRVLSLKQNRLSGAIPPELGQLTQLERLSLYDNLLSGSLPPALGALTNLVDLWLYDNYLTGPIPTAWSELAQLRVLLLSDNYLTGAIPPELGQLANLKHLFLSDNRLTGVIPAESGQLGSLEKLDLSRNKLSGPIPPELGQLDSLERLTLGGNELSGCIPPTLQTVQDHDLSSLALPVCEPG